MTLNKLNNTIDLQEISHYIDDAFLNLVVDKYGNLDGDEKNIISKIFLKAVDGQDFTELEISILGSMDTTKLIKIYEDELKKLNIGNIAESIEFKEKYSGINVSRVIYKNMIMSKLRQNLDINLSQNYVESEKGELLMSDKDSIKVGEQRILLNRSVDNKLTLSYDNGGLFEIDGIEGGFDDIDKFSDTIDNIFVIRSGDKFNLVDLEAKEVLVNEVDNIQRQIIEFNGNRMISLRKGDSGILYDLESKNITEFPNVKLFDYKEELLENGFMPYLTMKNDFSLIDLNTGEIVLENLDYIGHKVHNFKRKEDAPDQLGTFPTNPILNSKILAKREYPQFIDVDVKCFMVGINGERNLYCVDDKKLFLQEGISCHNEVKIINGESYLLNSNSVKSKDIMNSFGDTILKNISREEFLRGTDDKVYLKYHDNDSGYYFFYDLENQENLVKSSSGIIPIGAVSILLVTNHKGQEFHYSIKEGKYKNIRTGKYEEDIFAPTFFERITTKK